MKGLGLGVVLGVSLGACGGALARHVTEADHYETGWSVLVRGVVVCVDPYVRPSEREIECRSRTS